MTQTSADFTIPTTQSRLAAAVRRIRANPEIVGLQSYEYLLSDAMSQYLAFDSGAIRNPQLTYPRIRLHELEELASDVQLTMIELQEGMGEHKIDALYSAIEVRYAELHMLELAALIVQGLPPAEHADAVHWLRRANEAIFGRPRRSVFAALADRRMYDMIAFATNNPQVARLQRELTALIGKRLPPKNRRARLLAPNALPPQFIRIVHERFDDLVDHVDPQHEYDVSEVVVKITTALQKIGADAKGWSVEIIADKEYLSVSPHRKVVEIGENRDDMPGDELRAKIVHEVGVHVLRSINAEKAGWASATYGQDGYLDFEESFATMCGAAYWLPGGDKAFDEYRYLVAGFAYGFDGRPPRDFRECFEIIWRAMALAGAANGQFSNVAVAKARKFAYKQTVRMFRGTPCSEPGLVYLKDLAYIHGKKFVGQVLPLVRTQRDMDFLLSGKLDPTQAEHLRIAQNMVPHTSFVQALGAA